MRFSRAAISTPAGLDRAVRWLRSFPVAPSPHTESVVAGPSMTAGSSSTTALARDTAEPASTTWSPRSFTMAFTGDFLLHNRVNAAAASNASDDGSRDYDYEPLLAALEPLLAEVDWAVCHMEVSLSSDNTRLSPFPVFRAPGDIARDARRIGYDFCTTASNHVLDHGPEGAAETLEVLDGAGLGHTGSARSAGEAFDGIWIDLGGVRVAHLSYSYGFNGFTIPGDMPWLTNLIEEERILSDASRARREGADYVVLSLHWGEQYVHAPNRQQRELGPQLLASPDVDLIIGHHAHVVQPIDRIDGEWLVYGLGNLLSAQADQARRDELLVEVEVSEQAAGTFSTDLRAVPLVVDGTTLVVHRSNPQTRPLDIDPTLDAQLDASWSRVVEVLGVLWLSCPLGPTRCDRPGRASGRESPPHLGRGDQPGAGSAMASSPSPSTPF